mgnify:CR=1 FL=1
MKRPKPQKVHKVTKMQLIVWNREECEKPSEVARVVRSNEKSDMHGLNVKSVNDSRKRYKREKC